MSGMQGWPHAGAAPGPARGGDAGRRHGILALVIVATVLCSFGLAVATGADSREGGATAPPEMPDDLGLGDLEDPDFGAGGGAGGFESGGGSGGLASGGSGGADSGGSGSGGGSGDLASGGGSVGGGEPAPTTPPDPTLEAFKAVTPGDCLNNWMIGETEWASDLPEVTSCDADGAGMWVSDTAESTWDCPVDAGRSYLSYTSGLETVALCVTRQFEVGQCFLGMADGSANLMSWVDCEGAELPAPYSQKYNVTGVYSAPSNPTGDECRQSTTDQNTYWWWTVDAESILLCSVVY